VNSNYNGFDISCVGANDGSIDLTVNGGTAPYNYNWNNGFSTNEDINGLTAGTYSVVVTDANGCQDSTNIQLDDPTPLNLTLAIDTSILCNGDATGAINTTISGGTGTFNFNWNNGIGNVEDPNGLTAGNYILTVTDGNNCTIIDSINITEPTALSISATSDTLYNGFEISCNGANDGGIDLTINGGTTPYSYLWSNNDTIQNLDSLVAGTYSVTVTDSLGCQISTSITLNEPTLLTASATHVNPTCLGINNGSIDLTVNGGIAAYTYNWDNGIGNVEDPMNITAGIFTVTITDQNNCTITLSDTLTGNTNPLSVSGVVISNYNGFDISCPDSTNGNIDVTVSPIGAYTFNWSNGLPSSEDQFNLGAGTYSVTATDANGCFDTTSITITPPPTITTNISVLTNYNGSGISCNGASDANLDLTVNGGAGPYLYLWSNSTVIEDPMNIGAGNTSVIVTDQNGCIANDTITLSQPQPISSNIIITSDFNGNPISCLGAMDGAVDLTVTGGTGAYSYNWSTGDTIQDISNIGAGTYTVTITDANGCQDSAQVTIQAPDGFLVNATPIGAICANTNNGIITVNIAGGVTNYTFNWNNGLPNTQNQSNLSTGTYIVTVTDTTTGCFTIDTAIIAALPTPMVDISADSVCVGLTTSFFDNSNAPAGSAYAWDFQNDGVIDDNTVGTTAFQYPTSGNYITQLIITSLEGCRDTGTIDVFVEELVVSFSGLALEYCPNDTIVSLTGVPSGGVFTGNGIVSDTIFDPSQAPVGTNTITYVYTNALGCSESIALNTQVLPLPNLDAGDDITGTVNTPIQLEAIGAFSYEWSPATGLDNPFVAAPTAVLFETQTYTVTGTAGNGCSTTDEITVTIDNDINCLKLRTVFSPNGDGINETWSIECISFYDNTVEVYNRWGQLVFQAENYSNTWNGVAINGEVLPEDSYFYVVTITNQGYENVFKGSVTIVR
jgi:gliding motility-associated-like protein